MSSELEARETAARRAEAALDWATAAGAWASIAEALGRGGDADRAAQAWDAAGEAYRRDDRPALADKALKTALLLTEDAGLATVIRVKRSGCLAAMGQLGEARQVLMQAMLGPAHSQTVVADGQVDLALAMGDAATAQRWVAKIQGSAPVIAATQAFRLAQCARLCGDLDGADEALGVARGALPGVAGRAAVCGEQATLYEMRGQYHEALASRSEAMTLHGQERRVGPMEAALAGLLCTAAVAGVELANVSLDGDAMSWRDALRGALQHAQSRDLQLVHIELSAAKVLNEADTDGLTATVARARSMGALMAATRIQCLGAALGLGSVSDDARLPGTPLWDHRVRAAMGDSESVTWLSEHGVASLTR